MPSAIWTAWTEDRAVRGRRGHVPSDEERALFRQAVADARPLAHDKVHHEPPATPAWPAQRHRDERAALRESIEAPDPLELRLEGGDELAFLRPGLSRYVLRDLRRGRWVIQDQLDLHGATRDGARALLADFLASCRKRELRCGRVVHGKGLGSPGREPVLKSLTASWLARRQEVLAFCQARANQGGGGAVIVLLRANRQTG